MSVIFGGNGQDGEFWWGAFGKRKKYKIASFKEVPDLSIEERRKRIMDKMKPWKYSEADPFLSGDMSVEVVFGGGGVYDTPTPTPTPSVTPFASPTPTITITPTNTLTPSVTPSITPTQTLTPTPSQTPFPPAQISYRTFSGETNPQPFFDLIGVNFGTSGLVVVQIQADTTAPTTTVSSVYIDGGLASYAQATQDPGLTAFQGIYYRVVTGSTGNIEVNWNASVTTQGVGVWTITDYLSSTPNYTFGADTAGSLQNYYEHTTNQSLTKGSVGVVGFNSGQYLGRNFSWTGATENFDVDYSTLSEGTGASYSNWSGGTKQIVVAQNIPNPINDGIFQWVNWR